MLEIQNLKRQAYQEALPAQVESIIREGIQRGELKGGDPRLLSWHFVALVEVTLSAYAASLFANDDGKLDCVLDLFFDGAAAESEGDKEFI